MQKIIYVDVDETICLTPDSPRVYEKAVPIYENIAKINALYEAGHTIIYWTARGSRSGISWYDLTKKQLESWGAMHHDLKCNKPYYDLFIDDKVTIIENLNENNLTSR